VFVWLPSGGRKCAILATPTSPLPAHPNMSEQRRGRRTVKSWSRQHWWVAAIPATVLFLALLLWAVVAVPPRLIDPNDQHLADENALRTALLGILAGAAVVAGAIVGALNLRETSRQNRETSRQNRAVLELQRRGQITERFTRAIDQLGQAGDDKLDIRLGGIYALEQIARDSKPPGEPDSISSGDLHWPIMEILTSYVRTHALPSPRLPETRATEPAADEGEAFDAGSRRATNAPTARAPRDSRVVAADVQAIATVIGRRSIERDQGLLNVANVDLAGADLFDAHLEKADLRRAHLEDANLNGAHLGEADLGDAILPGANLAGANLRLAHLGEGDLRDAILSRANLAVANLWEAYLRHADLGGADLTDANLGGAYLTGVNHLTREQLQTARNVDWDEAAKAGVVRDPQDRPE